MPIVGIVGGLGPPSTIDYYRRLIAEWKRFEPGSSPSIVIDSLDVDVGLRLAGTDREGLLEYLKGSVRRLTGAGVDFIAMTANTAHLVFDELAEWSSVPILSIVETCAAEAVRRGVRRGLLLGTRFTMEAPFYPAVFARHGLAVVAPGAEDRTWIHARYVDELLRGVFREEVRGEFIHYIERMRRESQVDGVILGGTELVLILTSDTVAGLPALDTTALHVAAIIEQLRT